MARHHIRRLISQGDELPFTLVCEPSPKAYADFCALYEEAGFTPPDNVPDLATLLAAHAADLDAAFIITPHVLHFGQAKMCLEAGLDVLLEKPMVMTAQEAVNLIDVRDRTGRLLVVAFNGSLSPHIRQAVTILRRGDLGRILNIHGVIWQNWQSFNANTWRQMPELSGGGFMFDTGAHLLNTVADLAGEEFVEVAAWLDNRGSPVDIAATVMARLHSGALVTLSGCGNTIPSCSSDIRVFCTEGILRTGAWGRELEIQRSGESELSPVPVDPDRGVWEQFIDVRSGRIPNPSPPEVGLRMARLWDAMQASAADGGRPVQVG
jgi:predicted dehydrogenase